MAMLSKCHHAPKTKENS